MNDPHVVALEYRIEHDPAIDWSQAAALNLEEDGFDIRADNGRIRFNLKEHYGSEDEARSAVEADYIPNWEFHVGLVRGPSLKQVREALATYTEEVEASELTPSTKRTYLRHAETFVRWLEGDFEPGANVGSDGG